MKVVALLSGGIDSPVAVYRMLKQGCEVILVHFHSQTSTAVGSQNKVISISKQLKNFGKVKLYMVPFKDIQLELIKNIPAKVRTLIYRRMMLRIAERILEKENADFLVTGDNLGQVASQTLENINSVHCAVSHKILTPVLGDNKLEIIRVSKDIETYELSILPYEDCCSFLVSPHPELYSIPEALDRVESNIDVGALVKKGFESAKSVDLD